MMALDAAVSEPISPPTRARLGKARVAVKITALVALFFTSVPLLYVWRILGFSNPWPHWIMGAVTWIVGVELTVTGTRVKGNEFLVANHVSWIDIPALSAISGAAFVANDGLASHPFTRWLCKMNGAVLVARHDRTSVQSQIEQVRSAISTSGALAIFPEGTTSDGTGLLPFKSSLLSAVDPLPDGVAVQPVLLDYGSSAANIAWIGVEPGLDNFKRLLAQSEPITLNIHFHELESRQGAKSVA
jgi:lyso-ornithine lipid O-acyltransferase